MSVESIRLVWPPQRDLSPVDPRWATRTWSGRELERLSGATRRQRGYWTKIGMITPLKMFRDGRRGHLFPFRDVVKTSIIVDLLKLGLSIQWQREYLETLLSVCDFERRAQALSARITLAIDLRTRKC